LIEYSKSKYKELSLNVYAKNENALNFYYKNNFKVLGSMINEETNELEYTMVYKNN
jgi:putative acetyltransferase